MSLMCKLYTEYGGTNKPIGWGSYSSSDEGSESKGSCSNRGRDTQVLCRDNLAKCLHNCDQYSFPLFPLLSGEKIAQI